MTQNEHSALAFILTMITTQIIYYFFPEPEREEYWQEWIRNKFT